MPEAKISLTAVSDSGGTVANTSARSFVRLPFWAPLRAAVFTSRNFDVFSSGEPGILDIAAFTSARKDAWSEAANCFITEVMDDGSLIMSPILPRASADDIVLS